MKKLSYIGHSFDRRQFDGVEPKILSAASVTKNTEEKISQFRHPFWVIDYSVSACGHFKAGSSKSAWIPREKNEAHIYRPGTAYWEKRTKTRNPIESRYITFSGGDNAGLDIFVQNSKAFAVISDPCEILNKLLYEISVEASGGDKNFWRAQAIFARIIDILHKNTMKAKSGENSWILSSAEIKTENELFAEKVTAYLKDNLSRAIELQDISRHLNVSLSTLSHKYASITGESPLRTLMSMRISMAKALLLQGESLKATAMRTGFYDEFHFSKVFKKITAYPPKKYLKNMMPDL